MKILRWISDNILFFITLFLLAFIPLYPKIPIVDINNTWVYIRAEDFIVTIAFVLWLILLLTKKVTLKTPLTIPIIFFWIIGAISTIHGVLLIFPSLTGVHANVAFLSFLRRIEYISLFFIAFSGMKDKRFIPYIVAVFSVTLLFVVVYGVGQKYLGFPAFLTMNEEFAKGVPVQLSQLSRIPSTFGGHYDLAAYLVLVIPILTSMFFGFKNLLLKFFLIVVVCSGFGLLFMTVSRVSFFVLLVSMVIVLFLQKKKIIILSLFLLTFVFLVFSPSLLQRFGNTIKEVDVLVNTVNGEVIGHVKEVDSNYFKDKVIKMKFAQSKSEINAPIEENINSASQSSLIVEFSDLPPSVPLVVESNSPTGENLPQGTGYINLTLSPVIERLSNFYYQKSANSNSKIEVFDVHGDFLIKKALAYDLSFTTRVQAEWPNAIKSFERNILFGSGYSSISLAVDNNYLRILGEVGLLGFLSYFAIFLVVGIYIKKVLPEIDSPIARSLVLGFIAGVIGLGLNAILIDVFEASKIAFLLWLTVGLILGTLQLYKKKEIDIFKELKGIITSSYAVIICLFIINIIFFMPILNYYFVGDDFTWFRWIADCKDGCSIFRFFTDSDGFFYRPGTKTYFSIMYSAFWLNQTMYHLVSVLLHFSMSILVFLISRKIFKNFLLSVISAFLFLVLSGYSEAVFWISATGHLFNAVFILLSLFLFILWTERKKKIYFILSLISIVFSVLFHELGVIAPFLIILYQYITEENFSFRKQLKKPYLLVLTSPVIGYLVLRFIAGSHWFNGDYSYNILKLPFNFVGNIISYLFINLFGIASLPVAQALRNFSKEHTLIIAIIFLVAIFIFVMIYRKIIKKMVKEEQRIIIFGFLFFIISLLPFLGLGNVTSRYSYLSSVGFIILFVYLINKVFGYLKNNGKYIALSSIALIISIFILLHLIQLQQIHKDWHEAGAKSEKFLISMDKLYSSYWTKENMQFYFINVPIKVRDAWIFPVGLKDALWLVFRNPLIQVYQISSLDQAPQWVDDSLTIKIFEFKDDGSIDLIKTTKEK